MKGFFRKIVLWLLVKMAKFRLRKYKGTVIAVTGSIGKTSTKEAIYAVLNTRFKVKKSKKSMNSEFGLPLTILDIESGYSSVTKWSWFLAKAFVHCFMKEYSEVLLLEMGVDKPGDMDFLTSIVRPDIAVITNIHPVHIDEGQFQDLESIFVEKSKLVDALKDKGKAVLNTDNPFTAGLLKKLRGRAVGYGIEREADFRASQIKSSLEGTVFTLHHDNRRTEVQTKALGDHQIYVLLPAIACASLMGMTVEEAVYGLGKFELPPGRMNVIPAKKEATIVDSSYNSSPESLKKALEFLSGIDNRRRVAVIGDMNELGERAKSLHESVGEWIPKHADLLLTVGNNAKYVADAAEEKGMDKKKIHKFKTVKGAIDFFEEEIRKNDVVLVKGSQNNVRLERFVKALMEHPEDAKKLLVRQGKHWQSKL